MPQPLTSAKNTFVQPPTHLALTLLGPSSAMSQLWSQARRLAPHVRTVLLTGERHCGQAAAARLLLDLSPHPKRPFVECTADAAEQRLLGSSAYLPLDAFLFIPDLERYSLPAQEALLKLLRHRRSRPFTVAATAAEDTRSLVSTGRLVADLANLLGAVQLPLPPLRERAEDIPMLVSHMLHQIALNSHEAAPPVSEGFLRAAMAHSWPGNLDELAQVLQWTTQEARGRELTSAHIEEALRARQTERPQVTAPIRMVPLDTVVQEHIDAVLRACRGNKLRASEVLGISRSTLYRMLDAASVQHGSLSAAG